ncbi:MAG: hypothetical protein ACNS60_00550, partial [Candidatus Cyclobacteriaceae bacterium M2_1C_046]
GSLFLVLCFWFFVFGSLFLVTGSLERIIEKLPTDFHSILNTQDSGLIRVKDGTACLSPSLLVVP